MTQVDAEANFHPTTEPNPVMRLRDRAATAREEHQRRMARGSDFVIAVVRPRWVIILGWTAKTQRKADHWAYAFNVAFAFLVMLVSAFIARGVARQVPAHGAGRLGHAAAGAQTDPRATDSVVRRGQARRQQRRRV